MNIRAVRCDHCGKVLKSPAVPLEFDRRVGEYHDFGGVPDEYSQGWFDFGASCARTARKRARAALNEWASRLGVTIGAESAIAKATRGDLAKP